MKKTYLYIVKCPDSYFQPITLEKHKIIAEDEKYYKLEHSIEVTESYYSREIAKSFIDEASSVSAFLNNSISAWFTFDEDEAVKIANARRLTHIAGGKAVIRSLRKAIKEMEDHPFTIEGEEENEE